MLIRFLKDLWNYRSKTSRLKTVQSSPSTDGFNLYQIFYDDITQDALDPGFIPLDNRANERPDWYEFWVIREFFKNRNFSDQEWYGFVSTKLQQKTGLIYESLRDQLTNHSDVDVVLINSAWEQLAFFENPFQQGDFWHPGLLRTSQKLLNRLGHNIDLNSIVIGDSRFAFSNFILAKGTYWKRWIKLADALFEIAESEDDELGKELRSKVSYGTSSNLVSMKVFVQERLPAIILLDQGLKTYTVDVSLHMPPLGRIFDVDITTRDQLMECQRLKRKYEASRSMGNLQDYRALRDRISVKPLVPLKALDLGCGERPKNYFRADIVLGIDIREDIDKGIRKADLAIEPIPFEDEEFDYVTAHDFIEHIPRLIFMPSRRHSFVELMNEIWRVLKPDGKFLSVTPAFPHGQAWRDPTHVNIITDETFPLYFDDQHRLAAMYGFRGQFIIESQQWSGCNLITTMVKKDN